MRYVFGLLGLLVVLAIVSNLAKMQLSAVSVSPLPPATGVSATGEPPVSVKAQSQQLQDQVKQQLENAVQQARPGVPEN